MSLVDYIKTEFYNGTSWIDISAYVVTDFTGSDGFASSNVDDRVASLGTLGFSLNNAGKEFSPMGGDALRGLNTYNGWNKGTPIRLTSSFEGVPSSIFVGRVSSINTDSGNVGRNRVKVSCVDFMDVLAGSNVRDLEIQTNYRAYDGIDLMLDNLPVASTIDFSLDDVNNFSETFPTIFDDINSNTKVISEINKLTLSELGYFYIKSNGDVKFETSGERFGTKALTKLSVPRSLSDIFKLSTGDLLKLSTGDVLILSSARNPNISATMENLNIDLNDEIINEITIKDYPRKVESSYLTLFEINQPVKISENETVYIEGSFTDRFSGKDISGTDMIAPIATTDYLMNTLADGTGTNITANLTVVATYSSNRVFYALTSSYTGLAYITMLRSRGKGIYRYSPIETVSNDSVSLSKHGEKSLNINQKYTDNHHTAKQYSKAVIKEFKDAKSRIKSVTYLANLNAENMNAFMFLNVGDLIELEDVRSELTNYYFIVSRKYTISLGGIITYTYGVKQHDSLLSGGLVQPAVTFISPAKKINYGYLPKLYNPLKLTLSIWITYNGADLNANLFRNLQTSSLNGFTFVTGGTNQVEWYEQHTGTLGAWLTPNNSISFANKWHLVMTRDISSNVLGVPSIYINGVLQTLTVVSTPVGNLTNDTGLDLKIGSGFVNTIEDPRIYNRMLSQADVTELYNGGVVDNSIVTDGLIFQGNCLYSDDALGTTSISPSVGDKFIDNINRYIGTVEA